MTINVSAILQSSNATPPPFAASSLSVPLSGSFSIFGSQIAATNKTDRLQLAITSGTSLNGLTQNSIATPYTIDMAAGFSGGCPATSDAVTCGIAVSDGTKFVAFYPGLWQQTSAPATGAGVPQFSVDQWNSNASFSSQAKNWSMLFNPQCYFVRLTDDGVTRKFWISCNGKDYVQLFSHATNTFLTPTKFGIVSYNHSGIATTGDIKVAIYHWLVSSSVLGDAG